MVVEVVQMALDLNVSDIASDLSAFESKGIAISIQEAITYVSKNVHSIQQNYNCKAGSSNISVVVVSPSTELPILYVKLAVIVRSIVIGTSAPIS